MQNPQLQTILTILTDELQRIYAERLVAVILYGSQARGDAHEYSDIDVMVVLKGEVAYRQEWQKLSQFVADLSLEYNTVVMPLFCSAEDLAVRQSPLMINIRREGVRIL